MEFKYIKKNLITPSDWWWEWRNLSTCSSDCRLRQKDGRIFDFQVEYDMFKCEAQRIFNC